MEKYKLNNCLDIVFCKSWTHEPEQYITSLISLATFYADDDLTANLKDTFNKINVILLKIDMIKNLINAQTEYTCSIRTRPGDGIPGTFTFAPNIKEIDEQKTLNLKKYIDDVYSELKNIDIASLASYVKSKAKAAGHINID